MDYQRIYNKLINKYLDCTTLGYVERHHILPRCLGGDNSLENIVILSPKAHYVAHHLLYKIYPHNKKIAFAFWRMATGNKHQTRYFTSRMYDIAMRANPGFEDYNKRKKIEGFSEEEIQAKINAGRANKGKKKSLEGRLAIKEAAIKRQSAAPMVQCKHCGHSQKRSPNFFRYHNNNCARFV